MKRIYHTCTKCHTKFYGRTSRKYCSKACHYADRPASWNKGKAGTSHKPSTQIVKSCAQCAMPMAIHAYRAKNGTGIYCSQDCYMRARWGYTGCCHACGQPAVTRFCSPTCAKVFGDRQKARARQVRFWERKLALIARLGGRCMQCGIDDFRVLDIDHIDGSTKVRPKDGHYAWNRRFHDWDANEGNLQLLCANCHRLRTWEQRGFGPKDSPHHSVS